jgi:FPC/CPF motif-containing protein YcgG
MFNDICGFTWEELISNAGYRELLYDLLEHLKAKDAKFQSLDDLKKEIEIYYNGYSWTGEGDRILNPFTISKNVFNETICFQIRSSDRFGKTLEAHLGSSGPVLVLL